MYVGRAFPFAAGPLRNVALASAGPSRAALATISALLCEVFNAVCAQTMTGVDVRSTIAASSQIRRSPRSLGSAS
jgi:hypothetical protein